MIRQDYAQPMQSNALTAFGYILRKYAYMIALMFIIYVGAGLVWWIG